MQLLKRKKRQSTHKYLVVEKEHEKPKKRKEMEVKEDEENVLGAIEA